MLTIAGEHIVSSRLYTTPQPVCSAFTATAHTRPDRLSPPTSGLRGRYYAPELLSFHVYSDSSRDARKDREHPLHGEANRRKAVPYGIRYVGSQQFLQKRLKRHVFSSFLAFSLRYRIKPPTIINVPPLRFELGTSGARSMAPTKRPRPQSPRPLPWI